MVSNLIGLEEAVEKYDPEQDIKTTGGIGGMQLADAMITATNGNPENFSEMVKYNGLKKIAFRGGDKPEEMKAILRDLRTAGYNIDSYSHLTKKELLERIKGIKRDISGNLEELFYRSSFDSLEPQLPEARPSLVPLQGELTF